MYYLIIDDPLEAGDVLPPAYDSYPVLAAAEPRSARIRPPRGLERLLPRMIADRATVALVEPVGTAYPVDPGAPEYRTDWQSDKGWRITKVLPLSTVFGPEGHRIVALATEAQQLLESQPGAPEDEQAREDYWSAADQQYAAATWPPPVEVAVNAAVTALNTVGADGNWWATRSAPAGHGHEILGLAARDLRGTAPGWDDAAYALLTRPWACAVGPVHPSDTPQRFYTLIDTEDVPHEVGQVMVDYDRPAGMVAHPSFIALHEHLDDGPNELLGNLLRRDTVRVAAVTPRGDTSTMIELGPDDRQHDQEWSCPDGWTITDVLPFTLAMGPQGARTAELVQEALARIDMGGDAYDDALAQQYTAAVNAQFDLKADATARETAETAAQNALAAAGMDSWWWQNAAGCAIGGELQALAARHLLGTTPGWDWQAYALLTEPWRSVMGAVHPADDDLLHR